MKQDRPYPPLAHLLHGPRWQYRKLSRSYCIHLWESIWWNHLTRITPDTIRQQQGNLAKIVRKAILPEEML
jgi:hypothetical protein